MIIYYFFFTLCALKVILLHLVSFCMVKLLKVCFEVGPYLHAVSYHPDIYGVAYFRKKEKKKKASDANLVVRSEEFIRTGQQTGWNMNHFCC